MPNPVRIYLVAAVLALGLIPAASAQDSITIMQAGGGELLDDLKYLTLLAGPQGKKQWPNIEGTIESFLGGIDRKKPLRFDLIVGGESERYRPSFPIANNQAFINNLAGFGIAVKKLGGNFYKLSDGFAGFMRISNGYASIGELKTDVPANLPNPATALAPLVKKQYDLAVDIHNGAAGKAQRKASIQKIRTNLLAATIKKKGESAADYTVRKTAIENQMDELERFYVDSSQITLGWVTDVPKKEGRLELGMEALPGTSLDKSIKLLSLKPSYFGNRTRSPNAILSIRLTHPVDDLRLANFGKLFTAMQARDKAKIDIDKTLNAAAKASGKQLADQFFGMLDSGLKSGILDTFVEVRKSAAGKHTLLGGIATADSAAASKILKLLPVARPGSKVSENVDKQGDVAIHQVTMADKDLDDFKTLYGSTTAYVGIGKDAVWIAAGDGAVAALKIEIGKVAGDAAKVDPVFVDFYAKAGPWLELIQKNRGTEGNPEIRLKAIKAFKAGNDIISMKLRRVDNRVAGSFIFNEGILRFVGMMNAQFSEDNLE